MKANLSCDPVKQSRVSEFQLSFLPLNATSQLLSIHAILSYCFAPAIAYRQHPLILAFKALAFDHLMWQLMSATKRRLHPLYNLFAVKVSVCIHAPNLPF